MTGGLLAYTGHDCILNIERLIHEGVHHPDVVCVIIPKCSSRQLRPNFKQNYLCGSIRESTRVYTIRIGEILGSSDAEI